MYSLIEINTQNAETLRKFEQDHIVKSPEVVEAARILSRYWLIRTKPSGRGLFSQFKSSAMAVYDLTIQDVVLKNALHQVPASKYIPQSYILLFSQPLSSDQKTAFHTAIMQTNTDGMGPELKKTPSLHTIYAHLFLPDAALLTLAHPILARGQDGKVTNYRDISRPVIASILKHSATAAFRRVALPVGVHAARPFVIIKRSRALPTAAPQKEQLLIIPPMKIH